MAEALKLPSKLEMDNIEHSVRVFVRAFGDSNPFFRFMVLDYMKLPLTTPLTYPFLRVLFEEFVGGMVAQGASLVTLPGKSHNTAIWMMENMNDAAGPESDATSKNTDDDDDEAELHEYERKTNKNGPPILMEMHVRSRELIHRALPECGQYLHVIIAANIRDKYNSRARDALLPMGEMAAELNIPVYAEGTSDRATGILLTWGFEVIGEMKLGAGQVDEAGYPAGGGVGVTVTPMILRPGNLKAPAQL